MVTFYTICAIAFGLILVIQTLLTLSGVVGGGDSDTDFSLDDMGGGDAGGDGADASDVSGHHAVHAGHAAHNRLMVDAIRWVSVKGIIAGLAFFGLFGLLGYSYKMPDAFTFLLALAGGILVQFLITFAFRSLMSLRSDGSIHAKNALGCTGTVYIPIPAHRNGEGKIQIMIQHRTEEFAAQTCGERLLTGTQIQVVEVLNENLMLVKPVA